MADQFNLEYKKIGHYTGQYATLEERERSRQFWVSSGTAGAEYLCQRSRDEFHTETAVGISNLLVCIGEEAIDSILCELLACIGLEHTNSILVRLTSSEEVLLEDLEGLEGLEGLENIGSHEQTLLTALSHMKLSSNHPKVKPILELGFKVEK